LLLQLRTKQAIQLTTFCISICDFAGDGFPFPAYFIGKSMLEWLFSRKDHHGRKGDRHMDDSYQIKTRKHFVFYGEVQGVGFRYSARMIANSLSLTGWVENEYDGSVTAEVQGSPYDIDAFLERLREQPFIEISDIEARDMEPVPESSFHVRGY